MRGDLRQSCGACATHTHMPPTFLPTDTPTNRMQCNAGTKQTHARTQCIQSAWSRPDVVTFDVYLGRIVCCGVVAWHHAIQSDTGLRGTRAQNESAYTHAISACIISIGFLAGLFVCHVRAQMSLAGGERSIANKSLA